MRCREYAICIILTGWKGHRFGGWVVGERFAWIRERSTWYRRVRTATGAPRCRWIRRRGRRIRPFRDRACVRVCNNKTIIKFLNFIYLYVISIGNFPNSNLPAFCRSPINFSKNLRFIHNSFSPKSSTC